MKASQAALILPLYFLWHYTTALREILGIISNITWFLYHFFSVPVLIKTIYEPWHAFGASILSCLFGFIIRIAVVFFAFSLILLVSFVGIIVFIVWFAAPLILFLLFYCSIYYFSI